ncbi:MAG TPA: hypothetical protein DHW78_00525 [Ruminococcaceae bacterium]|nr:hypothetical protein [Oscillospiraceae bacterium]
MCHRVPSSSNLILAKAILNKRWKIKNDWKYYGENFVNAIKMKKLSDIFRGTDRYGKIEFIIICERKENT